MQPRPSITRIEQAAQNSITMRMLSSPAIQSDGRAQQGAAASMQPLSPRMTTPSMQTAPSTTPAAVVTSADLDQAMGVDGKAVGHSPTIRTAELVTAERNAPELSTKRRSASHSPERKTSRDRQPQSSKNGMPSLALGGQEMKDRSRISVLATPRPRQVTRKPWVGRSVRSPEEIHGKFLANSVDIFFASSLRSSTRSGDIKTKKIIKSPAAYGHDDVGFGRQDGEVDENFTSNGESQGHERGLAYVYSHHVEPRL